MDTDRLDHTIRTLLSGAEADWSGYADTADAQAFLARADFHGISALLAGTATDPSAMGSDVPGAIAEGLLMRRMQALFWEDEHRRMVAELLGALDAAGIASLLIKGTALAYTIYNEPAQRQRGDTDLVIREGDLARAAQVLAGRGFETEVVADEAVTVKERSFMRPGRLARHMIDLHWGVMNSIRLNQSFDFEDLYARARTAPRLCAEARIPCPVDALTIACVHRQIHLQAPYYVAGQAHYDADRLIWMIDIDLLARALSPGETAELADQAMARGIVNSCHDGFARAGALLGTPMPPQLAAAAEQHTNEGTQRYLAGSELQRQWMDLAAQPRLGARIRHLGALLFPPADYMRGRYPDTRWPLALLYLRRAAIGVTARLFSSRRKS